MFDLSNMTRAEKNKMFERLFWVSVVVGGLLISAVFVLGSWTFITEPKDVDKGVVVATGALALFTAFLWLAAAITARFARAEISTSTAVNSANLTLQLDNRFNSDRALRIRHGAVRFLAEKRGVDLGCDYDISPYHSDPRNRWNGLTSDLIDLFNYFDWIGYLTDEDESNAIDREVLRRKLGSWIINYYDMCKADIENVQKHHADYWVHLGPFYKDLLERRKKWYAENKKRGSASDEEEEDTEEELNAFLQREHVRSHRGFHPPPMSTPSYE
jgi:hypothetical protein